MWVTWNSHIAGENVKWYNHFTKGVTVSPKSKHITVLDPAIPPLNISQEKRKHMSTQRLVHRFAYNGQSLKTTQMSIDR